MKCCWYFMLTILFGFFGFNKINAQTFSDNQPVSANYAIEYFRDKIGEDAHLYTGEEYARYKKSGIKGHPFFVSGQMQNSELFYDGTLYKEVPLLFDIVRQEILISRNKQNSSMKLLNEKIKYFILAGHRFENISLTEGKENLNPGIYDIAFDGRARVLVKRAKHIEATSNLSDPSVFVEIDKFFIRNGNSVYAVDKKKSIVQALADKKDLVKTFIRKNKFRFKKNTEKELVSIAAYYETLK